MQWKKSHNIATNVSSTKSATTFGDLPDCWASCWKKNRRIVDDLRRHDAHFDIIVMSPLWVDAEAGLSVK